MTLDSPLQPSQSSEAWHPIHELHRNREWAIVRVWWATVVRDDRNRVPYSIRAGDVVGHVTMIADEGFLLEGFGFATWVDWEDARGAWSRQDAPEPLGQGASE
jgi:hypothetical protein